MALTLTRYKVLIYNQIHNLYKIRLVQRHMLYVNGVEILIYALFDVKEKL